MNMPIYCARGRAGEHLAAWLVTAPGRREVVCDGHLDASKTWAGARAQVYPVTQPPDVDAAPTQPALF
jgi:hypothetical protein